MCPLTPNYAEKESTYYVARVITFTNSGGEAVLGPQFKPSLEMDQEGHLQQSHLSHLLENSKAAILKEEILFAANPPSGEKYYFFEHRRRTYRVLLTQKKGVTIASVLHLWVKKSSSLTANQLVELSNFVYTFSEFQLIESAILEFMLLCLDIFTLNHPRSKKLPNIYRIASFSRFYSLSIVCLEEWVKLTCNEKLRRDYKNADKLCYGHGKKELGHPLFWCAIENQKIMEQTTALSPSKSIPSMNILGSFQQPTQLQQCLFCYSSTMLRLFLGNARLISRVVNFFQQICHVDLH
ncbi:hypothetical protein EGR_02011 [Echinococcus granulosus]|uniref:Uncharacterized protein n=1 Tax=Echinococcus granulosus TaxID=6210 RepID=W6UXD1_ECHGR|nr:hypothetical protein EGR_02011 [Echinococcus granulosus]EUB63207.1 hypothetical protein EGR_02011 [Echinococcus granulosus]